ncbi:TVP38/TMEM64 family protein [Lactobacillus delbrueckii]|uniref:TVP38/TMEM64 family protein n=1 Tax=Lactobacillus delbrueckii TaxID=1584 RepID=UPI001F171C85|nr:VTT domain-containing protein [Lactobacillus delbrueckii]GHN16291.1 membrane protein [Lactobacillus delbrueckii]
MSYEQSRKLINRLTIISTIVIIGLCIYWYQLGIFTSQAKMSAYLAGKKILGPIIFVLIQIIQVVIPIIPGGVSLLAGVVFFGAGPGLIYNYIGIVIGSLINFFLARYYGKSFILHIVSEESLEKYTKWTKNQKKFNWFFAICILAPVAPDDLLCLLAGLTEMKPWTYFWIIVLCKPWTIAAYSLGLVYGARWIMRLM